MVEVSTPPNPSVPANFCAESDALVISPVSEESAEATFWAAADAMPPAMPAIAAPLALSAEPMDEPIREPAEVPALPYLDTMEPAEEAALPENALENAAPPDVPALPSSLFIFEPNPLIDGVMVTDALPTLTAIYAPPSRIPSILSIPSRAASALSRRRCASARSAGVRGGCGLFLPRLPSLVLCQTSTSSACTADASMYSHSLHRSSGDCRRAVRDSRGRAYHSSAHREQSSSTGSSGRSNP